MKVRVLALLWAECSLGQTAWAVVQERLGPGPEWMTSVQVAVGPRSGTHIGERFGLSSARFGLSRGESEGDLSGAADV